MERIEDTLRSIAQILKLTDYFSSPPDTTSEEDSDSTNNRVSVMLTDPDSPQLER